MIIRLLRHYKLSLLPVLLLLISNNVFAQNWESPFFRDHSLVGKIWDTNRNTWITERQLSLELLTYDYILLGETHDNLDHHILQARFLDYLVTAGAKPAVVMEMLVAKFWQDQPRTWDHLEVLQTQARARNGGWPWQLYTPVLQSVVQHNLELLAGNVDSEALREWTHKTDHYTSEEALARYQISAKEFQQLKRDIATSHCGYADDTFIEFMANAQLQRDHAMTSALVNSKLPVVLIAGSGHVRNNYAIPMQLSRRYPRLSHLSIAFISVLPELLNPEDYLHETPAVFDILYFTPSHTNQDACVQYSEQLKNMRQPNAQ